MVSSLGCEDRLKQGPGSQGAGARQGAAAAAAAVGGSGGRRLRAARSAARIGVVLSASAPLAPGWLAAFFCVLPKQDAASNTAAQA